MQAGNALRPARGEEMRHGNQAGDPGAFARFDLSRVPSPAFVVDAAKVRAQPARSCADVGERSGAKVLVALKAFSMWSLGRPVGEYLDGVCASGLYEARLGREEYATARSRPIARPTRPRTCPRSAALSDHRHLQLARPASRASPTDRRAARAAGETFDIGLRINPMHSEGEVAKYDPAAPCSRLGFPVDPADARASGGRRRPPHPHPVRTGFRAAARAHGRRCEPMLRPYFGQLKWLNLGGGHHITRADYQRDDLVAFLQRGPRRTTGCEVISNPARRSRSTPASWSAKSSTSSTTACRSASPTSRATCHMPDVIEAPYRPAMLGEGSEGVPVRLGGPSCLAGDVIGDYRLPGGARIGQRFAFLDQAHYSMVKTNTFNGVPLPSIALWDSGTDDLRLVKSFDYEDFEGRLS